MYLQTHNLSRISSPKKQKGVALLTALIIAALAGSLAAIILERQQIQIRLSSNISTIEQTYQYAYGMEEFAGTILKTSWEDHPEYDSLNDDWYSETALVLPITGGTMTGKLHDLHARINLNSLIRPITEKAADPNAANDPNDTTAADPNDTSTNQSTTAVAGTPITAAAAEENPENYDNIAKVTQARIDRLIFILDELQVMGPAENFAAIVRDWIDSDEDNGKSEFSTDETIGNGAETPWYQSLETSYFSANTEMISPTELRLLKDFHQYQEQFYDVITNEVSVLPTVVNNQPTNTAINVNTASEIVLEALGFTPDVVTNILEAREEEPFTDLDSFQNVSGVSEALFDINNNPDGLVDPLDLGFKSEYFLLEGSVEINNTKLFLNSVLWRNEEGVVSVIMRDFSNPQTIKKAIN